MPVDFFKPRSLSLLMTLALAGCLLWVNSCQKTEQAPVRVGILHSLTGTMAFSEKPLVDATLLAIREINDSGGLLERKIEAVIADGASDDLKFADEAERLIMEEHVAAIFGCWTSACRKAVKPVVEKYSNILFYPVQYEGMEASEHIVYGGQSANQQILPAMAWANEHLGKRYFLVGSDYIFPHIANIIIQDQIKAMQAQQVGEFYLPLGSDDVESVIAAIIKAKPDVIINTINGESNLSFFKALRKAGISPQSTPTISFSISETEALQLGDLLTNDYVALSYFQSLNTAENIAFVQRFKSAYGSDRVISDPMLSSYTNVQFWAASVKQAETFNPAAVLSNIKFQHTHTAAGIVYVDQENNHQWKMSRIGQATGHGGQFKIVWQSNRPLDPMPFPLYRTRQQWLSLVQQHYEQWGGNWANPGPEKLQAAAMSASLAALKLNHLIREDVLVKFAAEASHLKYDSQHINRLETQWPGLPVSDPVIQALANNPAALRLKRFKQHHPRVLEILMTDMHGQIIAMTNKSSDYYQADESWWQQTYANAEGKSWQGDIEFDESANAWGIPVYLPIRSDQGDVIAIIKSIVDIGDHIPYHGLKP